MLQDGIETLKAIGPKRAQLFYRLGIATVEDMLRFYPRAYEDRSTVRPICEAADGASVLIRASAVTVVRHYRVRKGMTLQKVTVSDGTGVAFITWFNQEWIVKNFDISAEYFFFGKAAVVGGRLELTNPVYERCGNPVFTNCIMPLYPLTANLPQKLMQTTAKSCLAAAKEMEETLPDAVRERYTLCGIDYALQHIHYPAGWEQQAHARRRLAFEELFYMQLGLRLLRARRVELHGTPLADRNYAYEFISALPFQLTGAQMRVIEEITADLAGDRPMNRLVQGDVGCGKTVVAAAAMYVACKNGVQAAMMAPTEILAAQHYESLSGLLGGLGVRVALLTGGLHAKQKKEVCGQIRSGGVDVVIGTHALIQKDVEFHKLGLVVTDEQHRFGVKQRAALSEKGDAPHVLVMTATPIPRTLALILYGDLEVSAIDELPPGRKQVQTFAIDEGMRTRINNFMLKQIGEGRQVYIVCPMVEDGETQDLKAVTDYAAKLQRTVFCRHRVGVVHGRLKPREKDAVMGAFARGELDVLVSTTVIEVGVNVPNANTMVIENAERFGLSQLHQLRGRVGRGQWQSYCILFCQGGGEVTAQRMKIMTQTNDGFVIAEKDLQLRGPGEFFGTRQHGLPELKVANIYTDMQLMTDAGKAAQRLLEQDRTLAAPAHAAVRRQLGRMFCDMHLTDFN